MNNYFTEMCSGDLNDALSDGVVGLDVLVQETRARALKDGEPEPAVPRQACIQGS